MFDDGQGPRLYGGGYAYVPGLPANLEPVPLFLWDGSRWLPQSVGMGGTCLLLLRLQDTTGPFLFLEGYFTGGGAPVYWAKIRRPGGSWEQSPPGLFAIGAGYPTFGYQDPLVPIIIGIRAVAPQTIAVARWTGSVWQVLGGPTDFPSVNGFAVLDQGSTRRLCVCGGFSHIGGVVVPGVAMWNGANWEAVGSPTFLLSPRTLAVFDDGTGEALYLGGDGQPPGSPAAGPPLFKWTGTQWVEPGGGLTITTNSPLQVNAMHVFDDGSGPALYAAGSFNRAGGIPVRNIARWNGTQWQAVGAGIGFQVQAFADFDDGRGPSLFAGGSFTTAGGGAAPGVAQWVGCPNCYANCDLSTRSPRLNVLDFMCFLNKFAAQYPYANCTVDATIDISDFACFLNKFAAGCP